jgi:AmmeMemoRadiSam system protein B
MSMRTVRQPAVAGRFYPGSATELSREVDRLLGAARAASAPPAGQLRALLVPHAGYRYSGPTAACGYALAEAERERFTRVLLLGPAHFVGFPGLAVPGVEAFATPLGEVALDTATLERLCDLPQVTRSDAVHAPEHSLEVQLPFLQRTLGTVTLVPVAVGDASADDVAAVVDACWSPDTLLLVSSDLSHYLPYAQARATDADTLRRVLAREGPLPEHRACGVRAVDGLLLAVRQRGLHPSLIDARNSGDTAGDPSRVVGYAAVSFTEEATR